MDYYSQDKVVKAFGIYSKLASSGRVEKDEVRQYQADDEVRGLVDEFAKEVSCAVFMAGEHIYMIPLAMSSEFHVSNESIKKTYLPSKSQNNPDIYIMYVAIIILFGEFYDGYQSSNPTRDFISVDEWLEGVNERIDSLREHDEETLGKFEAEHEYNWKAIIDRWSPLDDLKEGVKQDSRTASRISILNTTRKFLAAQDLIREIGNDEIEMTQKARTVVQRYYMDYEYNRGILDFMYGLERNGGE